MTGSVVISGVDALMSVVLSKADKHVSYGSRYQRKYRGADESLARPVRKQARKHVREARDFNNTETRSVIIFFLQGKAPKEIHAILTETLAFYLPDWAKDLSAPLYKVIDEESPTPRSS